MQAITSKTMVKDINGKEMKALEVIIITYQFMLEDFWKIMEERMCINFHKDNGDVQYVIIMPPHSDRNVQDFIFHSAVEVRKYFCH